MTQEQRKNLDTAFRISGMYTEKEIALAIDILSLVQEKQGETNLKDVTTLVGTHFPKGKPDNTINITFNNPNSEGKITEVMTHFNTELPAVFALSVMQNSIQGMSEKYNNKIKELGITDANAEDAKKILFTDLK